MIIATQDLAEYLDLDTADDQLDGIRSAVEAACVQYAARPFEATTRTWYLDGSGGMYQFLPEPLASAPTSVHVDTGRTFGSGTLYTHGTDYVWRDTFAQRLQSLNSYWTEYAQDVKVVGTVGYAAAAMPADVKLTVRREAARAYNHMVQRARQGGDVAMTEAIDDADVDYFDPNLDVLLSKAAKLVLNRYKALPLPI